MLLGIMGAMPEEMDKIIASITNKQIEESGSRIYYRGELFGQEVVAVFSRWGKVAAAATVTHLILEYKVDRIIFTGVAGAISPELNVGDVVIGQRLFQHDMDARPLMRRF
ncbi:MAG: 5'-methylthioadenosine/S-adenosylhomocysteine nucleosidase, partial [Paludibacter sp.]